MNPAWLAVDNIERRSALSVDEFIQQYESKRKPVVLKNVVTQWKAFQVMLPVGDCYHAFLSSPGIAME